MIYPEIKRLVSKLMGGLPALPFFVATVYQPEKLSPQRHRGHGETQRKKLDGTTNHTKSANNVFSKK
jgi:hypothetical protein